MALNCSSFVYYSWKSLFTKNIMKGAEVQTSSLKIISIYKTFIRPHLDYGNVTYYHNFEDSFSQRLEPIQYNAPTAITGIINGTSLEKLFQELRFETLKSRRQFIKLYLFYKILHSKSPSYLFKLIPENNNPYASRSDRNNQIPFFNVKTTFLKNTFFSSSYN